MHAAQAFCRRYCLLWPFRLWLIAESSLRAISWTGGGMGLTGSENPSYIPTLDGWRAIAILAVLGYHTPVLHVGPLNTMVVHNYGSQGVDLFFAISGLLI